MLKILLSACTVKIKKKLFLDLGNICNKDTILASNTSSIPIGILAEASGRPSKVVEAYTKFQGLPGGSVTIGNMVADPDGFNDNKFTLARVALAFELGNIDADWV